MHKNALKCASSGWAWPADAEKWGKSCNRWLWGVGPRSEGGSDQVVAFADVLEAELDGGGAAVEVLDD